MHRHCAPFLFSKRSPSQTKSARKRCKAPCPRKRRYAGPPRQRPRARPRLRQASARLKTVRAALAAEAPLRKPAAPAPPGHVRAFVRRKGGVNRAIGVRPLARRMRIPKSAQGRPERKTVATDMARAPPQGRGRSAGAPDQRPQDVLVFSEKRFSRLA